MTVENSDEYGQADNQDEFPQGACVIIAGQDAFFEYRIGCETDELKLNRKLSEVRKQMEDASDFLEELLVIYGEVFGDREKNHIMSELQQYGGALCFPDFLVKGNVDDYTKLNRAISIFDDMKTKIAEFGEKLSAFGERLVAMRAAAEKERRLRCDISELERIQKKAHEALKRMNYEIENLQGKINQSLRGKTCDGEGKRHISETRSASSMKKYIDRLQKDINGLREKMRRTGAKAERRAHRIGELKETLLLRTGDGSSSGSQQAEAISAHDAGVLLVGVVRDFRSECQDILFRT